MQTRQQARNRQVLNGDTAAPAAEPPATTSPNGASGTTNGDIKVVSLEPKATLFSALKSVSSLLLYLASSSLIIILNKRLMVDDGFKYPLALTGMAQLAGAVSGILQGGFYYALIAVSIKQSPFSLTRSDLATSLPLTPSTCLACRCIIGRMQH